MNSAFTLIDDLTKFLAQKEVKWFVSGGWAIDMYLDRKTRARYDLDMSVPFSAHFKCKDADFVSAYFDESGNRRISYHRDVQHELDYIEVFFDKIEAGYFVYRRENQIKRRLDQAILTRDGVRYLAPEVVLLLKSTRLSKKNIQDFDIVIDALDRNALIWLMEALLLAEGNPHPWVARLREKT